MLFTIVASAESERSNERAEGVESKFIDIEDELKVS